MRSAGEGRVAYIGLGSNLDGPRGQVSTALQELGELPRTRLLRHSSLYRSPPLGPAEQPDYVNAVAALETALEPRALLRELQALERRHGRRRATRWGPRTLDLDILLFGDLRCDETDLTLPHPELPHRAFVLVPLGEIAPDLVVPGLGSVAALADRCDRRSLERLA